MPDFLFLYNVDNIAAHRLKSNARVVMRSYDEYHKILSLWEMGTPKKTISTLMGIPRRTVIDCIQRYNNLDGLAKQVEENPTSTLITTLQTTNLSENPLLFEAYAYLLGIYLGDGCISLTRNTPRLRIALGTVYPNIIKECSAAIECVLPNNKVGIVKKQGNCVEVGCFSNLLPQLFPQHALGKKHDREIKLEAWQQRIVDAYPLQFWKGLYHSDGSRFSNMVSGKNYPRYQFTNASEDLIQLFTKTCDALDIHWTLKTRSVRKSTHQRAFDIYVSKRKDVEFLDRVVGAKS